MTGVGIEIDGGARGHISSFHPLGKIPGRILPRDRASTYIPRDANELRDGGEFVGWATLASSKRIYRSKPATFESRKAAA